MGAGAKGCDKPSLDERVPSNHDGRTARAILSGVSALRKPLMFALIRHAGYRLASGSLTPDGERMTGVLSEQLAARGGWHEIRVSSTERTRETGSILSDALSIPMVIDARIGMDGDLQDLLPPTEPHGIIFVSHLPILTKMLRAWAKRFGCDEPPLTEVASGYLVDPEAKQFLPIGERTTPDVS